MVILGLQNPMRPNRVLPIWRTEEWEQRISECNETTKNFDVVVISSYIIYKYAEHNSMLLGF